MLSNEQAKGKALKMRKWENRKLKDREDRREPWGAHLPGALTPS